MKVEMKKGEVIIRSMQEKDRAEVLKMITERYFGLRWRLPIRGWICV